MDAITLELPIYLEMGKRKKKTISLNLNCYRNWSFHQNDDIKKEFKERISSLITHLPQMTRVDLTYRLFFGSKRSVDISNICCVVDKFFSDALVELGKLPDDNMEIISDIRYRWGGVDAINPRVEVTLDNIELVPVEEKPMQIRFIQDEIVEAIREYLEKQITLQPGQNVSIDLKATRGEDGIIAEVQVSRDLSGSTVEPLSGPQVGMTAVQAEALAAPVTRAAQTNVKTAASPAPAATPAAKPAPEPKKETAPAKAATAAEAKAAAFDAAIEAAATDTKQAAVEAQLAAQAPAQEPTKEEPKQETVVTPVTSPKAIFPSAATSAPTPPPAGEPAGSEVGSEAETGTPKPVVKSLFANLTKPVNQAPAE